MTSPQRKRALAAFRESGVISPKALSERLGCSQEAARALVRRMTLDGQIRPEDGGYVIREGSGKTLHSLRPAPPEESNGSNAQGEDEYPGYGIGEYRASTGKGHKWTPPYA